MKALIAAGDVGGARAVMASLPALATAGCSFDILDHGFLGKEADRAWPRLHPLPDVNGYGERLARDYQAYVFGTSVHDTLPLRLARISRECGIPAVCVLDNWMNYRWRLEMDGQPVFWPEAYAVMDDLARREAIAEGVPGEILHVTGHPALAGVRDGSQGRDPTTARDQILKASGVGGDGLKLVVFVSEPAERDQGKDPSSSRFRGYTEKSVLRLLTRSLQDDADRVRIGLLAHPREDAAGLRACWEECRGHLEGGMLAVPTGRDALRIADGVCGMASILLFEAMLIGKPAFSLQPNLRVSGLDFLKKKGLPFFVTDEASAPAELHRWLDTVCGPGEPSAAHPDLRLHERAPAALAGLIRDIARRGASAD